MSNEWLFVILPVSTFVGVFIVVFVTTLVLNGFAEARRRR
jgi:hypothetical protein